MLQNYFKAAVRNLAKRRGSAAINIIGLSIGMAGCLLMFLYVHHELAYDDFHEKKDRIFRVTTEGFNRDGELFTRRSETPQGLSIVLEKDISEVVTAVRVAPKSGIMTSGGDHFFEANGFLTSSSFFDVFTFEFTGGDPETALTHPLSMVVSEQFGRKYFATDNPMGRTIRVGSDDYEITGVLTDIPENSHLQFDYLLAADLGADQAALDRGRWRNLFGYTYVLLQDRSTTDAVEASIPDVLRRHIDDRSISTYVFHLQPLPQIHLYSDLDFGLAAAGEINSVYLVLAIALFILAIACINFINLSVSLSTVRLREVGMRKVLGATRAQITKQFLAEVLLLCLVAAVIGLALTELFLPRFSHLVDRTLDIRYDSFFFFTVMGLVLFTSSIAGGIHAAILSRLQPVDVFRTNLALVGSKSFNRSLVVFQFVVSILFVITALVMTKQLGYVKENTLESEFRQVAVIPTIHWSSSRDTRQLLTNLREELSSESGVLSVTGSSYHLRNYFGMIGGTDIVIAGEEIGVMHYDIDDGYLKTMGLRLVEGRTLSSDFPSDAEGSVLINQTLANELWSGSPIGKMVLGKSVIGVVEDFHFESLYKQVQPLILTTGDLPICYILLNLQEENAATTLARVKEIWSNVAPDLPFNYTLQSEENDLVYAHENRRVRTMMFASVFAILVACLGILGLTNLSINRRRKELSIRRILGATPSRLAALISREFLTLILIANIVTAPVAYLVTSMWLENFAYRVEVGPAPFILAGSLMFFASLSVILIQVVREARANPVASLRCE